MDIDQLEQMMLSQNPQWVNRELEGITLSHTRDLFTTLEKDLSIHRLILSISGPRRIGKTYLLKQLMLSLFKNNLAKPQSTLYFQFSARLNEQDIISDLIQLYLRKYSPDKNPCFIFLDEVQYIDYWQDQLKTLYDQHPRVHFVVTGSTSLFFRQKSKESLAGRIIKKSLNSLSFTEYLRFAKIPVSQFGDRAHFLTDLPVYRTEFKTYLVRGQLPELVFNSNLNHFEYLNSLLDQLINFDVAYLQTRLDRTLFYNLVRSLSTQIGQEYSINALASDFKANRAEIGSYVKILEEIGLFKSCLNGYFRKMRAKLSASKKIYTLNTNLTLAVNGFDISYLNDTRIFGQYTENYVFTRLITESPSVEYYREQGRNREVDFMVGDKFYEVKTGKPEDLSAYQDLAQKRRKSLTIVDESTFPWYLM